MLGESVVCNSSGTPQSWCGRPMLFPEIFTITSQSIHGILLSIITIVVRLKTSHRDKLMSAVLYGFSVADLMLNIHVGMSASKDSFFNMNHVPRFGQSKYKWCNAAATMQMLGLIGYVFLIPCAGFAFVKGLQFIHRWTSKTASYLFITLACCTVTYTLTLTLTLTSFGPQFGSLTDACSYILIGSHTDNVLWNLTAVAFSVSSACSILIVTIFYGMAAKNVLDMNKEITKTKAVYSGNRKGHMVVVKHFFLTILFPSLTIILPSAIAIVLAAGVAISSKIQFQLSAHWMAIVPLGNNYIFLFRKCKATLRA